MEHNLLVCGGREEEGLCRVGLEMASAVGRKLQVAQTYLLVLAS